MAVPAQMIPVDSSNLKMVGYSHDSWDLYIEFKSGGTYRYPKVPPAMYREMMTADSVGAFFSERFKRSNWEAIRIS